MCVFTLVCAHLQHYPDHTKGLILMGDLNVNHLKNLDAAEQVIFAML